MNVPLSRAERALLQSEPKPPKPRKVNQGPTTPAAAFNAVQFYTDLMNAAKQLNVKTPAAVAKDTGVDPHTITRMARGLAPCLGTCLLLCDWAGLDPLRYLIRLDAPAANDPTINPKN